MADTIKVEMAYWDRQEVVNKDGHTESLVIPYFVFGVEDETAALAAAYANTPTKIASGETISGVAQYIDRETIEIDERMSEKVWKVRVNYPKYEYNTDDENNPTFTFDTTGGRMHMDVALEHIGDYVPEGVEKIPNYNGAINVDKNGEVKGIDIIQPTFSFTIEKILSNSRITNSFKRNISDKTGCVNSNSFQGWSAGEVLFQGVSGTRRGKKSSDKWELVYKFEVSMNSTSMSRGGITIPSKKGWEYIWFTYKEVIQNDVLIRKPTSAHIEQVYRTTSFSNLW